MNPQQPEQVLECMLEDAAEVPVLANLSALWQQAEQVILPLPSSEQLRLGGMIIAHLADLHQVKAEHCLADWENTFNPQDPTVPGDWLQGLIRQSQHVDVSELTAPVQRRPRRQASTAPSHPDVVVTEVPKATVLKMLDQVGRDAETSSALEIAHAENVEASVHTIDAWFDSHPQPIPLPQLQQQLGWPLVKLWLSLLLGGFQLQGIEEQFYSTNILVSGRCASITPQTKRPFQSLQSGPGLSESPE